MNHRPRILIIGSGAVGAVFAEHLTRAGCEVAFLVRDPASPNARMPRSLHRFRLGGKTETVSQALPCVSAVDSEWDQCWICLPSTALDSAWLRDRLRQLPASTGIISWTPDLVDQRKLETLLGRPVATGLIGFISFQAPLPGESTPPDGIACLLPPRSAVLEQSDTGKRAARLLRDGGLPAVTSSDLPWLAARLTAMTVTAMAALECEQWSLSQLRDSGRLKTTAGAARQAIRVGAASLGRKSRLAHRLPSPLLYRIALQAAPPLMPFDLENYLGYHFAKVADQTRLMLETWIGEGRKRGLPVDKLETLRQWLADPDN